MFLSSWPILLKKSYGRVMISSFFLSLLLPMFLSALSISFQLSSLYRNNLLSCLAFPWLKQYVKLLLVLAQPSLQDYGCSVQTQGIYGVSSPVEEGTDLLPRLKQKQPAKHCSVGCLWFWLLTLTWGVVGKGQGVKCEECRCGGLWSGPSRAIFKRRPSPVRKDITMAWLADSFRALIEKSMSICVSSSPGWLPAQLKSPNEAWSRYLIPDSLSQSDFAAEVIHPSWTWGPKLNMSLTAPCCCCCCCCSCCCSGYIVWLHVHIHRNPLLAWT